MKSGLYELHPVPTRGALAIATNAGRVAMDVESPVANGVEAYGKDVWS